MTTGPETLFEDEEVFSSIALATRIVAPPPGLRGRVMAAVFDGGESGLGAIRAEEAKWSETGVPGVTYRDLYMDLVSGMVTRLVRMAPGSAYPSHDHKRDEQCYILEGDLWYGKRCYRAGDFTYAKAGAIDPELRSLEGNLLLIVASPDNDVGAI